MLVVVWELAGTFPVGKDSCQSYYTKVEEKGGLEKTLNMSSPSLPHSSAVTWGKTSLDLRTHLSYRHLNSSLGKKVGVLYSLSYKNTHSSLQKCQKWAGIMSERKGICWILLFWQGCGPIIIEDIQKKICQQHFFVIKPICPLLCCYSEHYTRKCRNTCRSRREPESLLLIWTLSCLWAYFICEHREIFKINVSMHSKLLASFCCICLSFLQKLNMTFITVFSKLEHICDNRCKISKKYYK